MFLIRLGSSFLKNLKMGEGEGEKRRRGEGGKRRRGEEGSVGRGD